MICIVLELNNWCCCVHSATPLTWQIAVQHFKFHGQSTPFSPLNLDGRIPFLKGVQRTPLTPLRRVSCGPHTPLLAHMSSKGKEKRGWKLLHFQGQSFLSLSLPPFCSTWVCGVSLRGGEKLCQVDPVCMGLVPQCVRARSSFHRDSVSFLGLRMRLPTDFDACARALQKNCTSNGVAIVQKDSGREKRWKLFSVFHCRRFAVDVVVQSSDWSQFFFLWHLTRI